MLYPSVFSSLLSMPLDGIQTFHNLMSISTVSRTTLDLYTREVRFDSCISTHFHCILQIRPDSSWEDPKHNPSHQTPEGLVDVAVASPQLPSPVWFMVRLPSSGNAGSHMYLFRFSESNDWVQVLQIPSNPLVALQLEVPDDPRA